MGTLFNCHSLGRLQRAFTQNEHLFDKCENLSDLAATLYSRLYAIPDLVPLVPRLEATLSPPYLIPRHPLPDLPHPALLRTLTGHTDEIHDCAINSDGEVIVSASEDKTLKVWDAQTGAERFTLQGHNETVMGCAISRDGTIIVSASWDNTLWDLASGDQLLTLAGHSERVKSMAITPNGKHVISASDNGIVKVWDLESGDELLTLLGHDDAVRSVAVTQDGAYAGVLKRQDF